MEYIRDTDAVSVKDNVSNVSNKSTTVVEMIGTAKYHAENKSTVMDGTRNIETKTETFLVDNMAYLNVKECNKWFKAKVNSPEELGGLLPQANGSTYATNLKKDIGMLTFKEEKDVYRFTVDAKDPVQARKLRSVLYPGSELDKEMGEQLGAWNLESSLF